MRKEIFTDLLKADNKIEVLKLMPSKIDGGIVFNFNGDAMFNADVPNVEIMNIDAIKSRYTEALEKKYLDSLSKVDFGTGVAEDVRQANDEPTLEQELIRYVDEGDKKAVRAICKQLKDKWFALDADDVDDAIDDIKDCVSSRDVDAVKDILAELDGDEPTPKQADPTPTGDTGVTKEQVVADIKEKRDNVKKKTPTISEVAAEILEDLNTAIADNDADDITELLSELAEEVGKDSGTYKHALELSKALATVEETPKDTTEADEIILDLEDCIAENDMDDAKKILKELADEIGEDSELYKKWAAKVEPKKSRRERRGK